MLSLTTAIGAYPHTAPLKDGRVTSTQLRLDHVQIEPVNRAFRPMVNQLVYDVSEMALVTLMLARALGRPLRALPVVLMRQSAHAMLSVRADSSITLDQVRTIGVRAYTQTTGTWLRGILADQFGVDLSRLHWLTFEPAHVDGYDDPPNCTRAPAGQTLLDAVLTGAVDAAIGLEPHPQLRPLLPADAESLWLAQTGIAPINHVLTIKPALVEAHPWLPSELFLMFNQSRDRAIAEDHATPAPYGLEPNRSAIEQLTHYAHHQAIIPRAFAASDLFEPF